MTTSTDPTPEGEPLARDIMTTPAITVKPDLGVKELVTLFTEKHIGGAPVVDDDGRLVGIVTEGDLMAMDADIALPHYFEIFDSIIYLESEKKFRDRVEKAAAANVEQLMTDGDKVKTIGPDEPARAAATLMSKHRFDRVPVVDEGGKVLGIVTRHDIMKILGL
jgi:CBS domain-containing protein